jgi:hypothetical protein
MIELERPEDEEQPAEPLPDDPDDDEIDDDEGILDVDEGDEPA